MLPAHVRRHHAEPAYACPDTLGTGAHQVTPVSKSPATVTTKLEEMRMLHRLRSRMVNSWPLLQAGRRQAGFFRLLKQPLLLR